MERYLRAGFYSAKGITVHMGNDKGELKCNSDNSAIDFLSSEEVEEFNRLGYSVYWDGASHRAYGCKKCFKERIEV